MTHPALFDLTGKVAIITGGSRGIGFEMAKAFAAAGAKVVIASRKQADLDAAVAEVKSTPADGHGMAPVYGLAGSMPLRRLVDDLLKRYVDVLYRV